MAMDVLERLNRKFGVWYEGLFGGSDSGDLRPRDILRRILTAMEDGRREALDGKVYVPNVYTLQIVVENDDERDYLRTFLNAEDLAAAVARAAEQHGYLTRGPLSFTVEEMPAGKAVDTRVHIRCRFDASVPVAVAPAAAPAVISIPPPDLDQDSEPGTVPAIPGMGMAPLASLIVRGADGHLQDVYPLTVHGAKIGRGRSAGNDIVLAADGMISKSHARIMYEGGGFSVRDENSTNGTFLGTEPLIAGQAYPLRSGAEIRLGQTVIGFRVDDRTAPAPSPAAPVQAASAVDLRPLTPVAEPEPIARRPFRFVSATGESYPLASAMTVGRGLTSDIVAIGAGVATQHARLSLRGETVYVEDLRTPGGTSINGERIPSDFPVALYEGDQIAFGEVIYRLERGAGVGGWR